MDFSRHCFPLNPKSALLFFIDPSSSILECVRGEKAWFGDFQEMSERIIDDFTQIVIRDGRTLFKVTRSLVLCPFNWSSFHSFQSAKSLRERLSVSACYRVRK